MQKWAGGWKIFNSKFHVCRCAIEIRQDDATTKRLSRVSSMNSTDWLNLTQKEREGEGEIKQTYH